MCCCCCCVCVCWPRSTRSYGPLEHALRRNGELEAEKLLHLIVEVLLGAGHQEYDHLHVVGDVPPGCIEIRRRPIVLNADVYRRCHGESNLAANLPPQAEAQLMSTNECTRGSNTYRRDLPNEVFGLTPRARCVDEQPLGQRDSTEHPRLRRGMHPLSCVPPGWDQNRSSTKT